MIIGAFNSGFRAKRLPFYGYKYGFDGLFMVQIKRIFGLNDFNFTLQRHIDFI